MGLLEFCSNGQSERSIQYFRGNLFVRMMEILYAKLTGSA